jgi:hypothetical protein
MDKLSADLRFAFGWLRRSPGFVAVAVASLGIGIAFNATLSAVVDAVLLRPLPVRATDRLVDIYTSGSDGDPWNTSSYPDYRDLTARNQVFSGVAGDSAIFAAVRQGDRARLMLGEVVTGNFFEVLGVTAARGRLLRPSDDRDGAERVAVVSYRYWMREFGGATDVVGQSLRIGNQPYAIVGALGKGARPRRCRRAPRAGAQGTGVAGEPAPVPRQPDDGCAGQRDAVSAEGWRAMLLSGAGLVAMTLAAIGLYGVIAYSVARRTREIGIRMAFGAARASVLTLIMRQGLGVAVGGLVLGSALALVAARALAGVLYGVSAADPIARGGAAAVLFAIAALANVIPASRAARIQPTVALRSE